MKTEVPTLFLAGRNSPSLRDGRLQDTVVGAHRKIAAAFPETLCLPWLEI